VEEKAVLGVFSLRIVENIVKKKNRNGKSATIVTILLFCHFSIDLSKRQILRSPNFLLLQRGF